MFFYDEDDYFDDGNADYYDDGNEDYYDDGNEDSYVDDDNQYYNEIMIMIVTIMVVSITMT